PSPLHPISVPRVLRRHLSLPHVLQHAITIPLAGVAPAAGAGGDVAEDVAAADRERRLGRQLLRVAVGVENVARGCPGSPAVQPVGTVPHPVGPDLERRLLREQAEITYEA